MINVAIDTSALEANKSINDANYKALKRLVESEKLTVHIPHIVKREIESQEKEFYMDSLKKLQTGLRAFNRVKKSSELENKMEQIKNEIDQLLPSFHVDCDRFSRAWVEGLNSQICDLNLSQTYNAWEAYFNGEAPLTSKKQRFDIPDSFICRSFEEIQESVGELVILAKDNKVYNTFKDRPNFEVYRTIRDFISSESIQEELEELDTLSGILIVKNTTKDLLGFVQSYENSNSLIKNYLSHNIGEYILDRNIYDMTLSNEDDGEATIASYYDGKNIVLNFSNSIHFGENQIGIEFTLDVDVIVEFFINKYDYYSHFYHDNSKSPDISVQDWNEHVYLAEKEESTKVKGLVTIEIDPSFSDYAKIAKYSANELDDFFCKMFKNSKIEIQNIEEIHLDQPNSY